MIKLNQVKMSISHTDSELRDKIRKSLKLNNDNFTYKILKKSVDARKKPELFYVYSLAVSGVNDEKILAKAKNANICLYKDRHYAIPEQGEEAYRGRPVVIGAGPAGLFCAYVLCLAGYSPIVIERGRAVEDRKKDVEDFWKTGVLNPASNVQFGEGGAGTFSDGKLNTAVKDPGGRNNYVLQTFVKFGANDNILYDNKPHIGTDILSEVIANMRKFLIEKGTEFRFETCVTDFEIESDSDKAGKIKALICQDKERKEFKLETDLAVLAIGHSSRDTFNSLYKNKIYMEAKNFAVGFRVEHPQQMINNAMYGESYPDFLPASSYKVTSNFPNGRGVYSFCMCPGGYVVNSSSEEGRTVVNGMSYSGRSGSNANSAIIVSVSPEDFGADDALAGVRYQQMLEEKNYKLCKGRIPQQLFGDFCEDRSTVQYGDFCSTTKGETEFANLRGLMSKDMEESFISGMKHFGHIVPQFDRFDAILSGMETRTSSPVRINRDDLLECNIKGIYPCGEGAGYAGGITSAAMDGIKVAEAIIKRYKPN